MMPKNYYYCQECQNTAEFNHDCVIDKITQTDMGNAFNVWLKHQPNTIDNKLATLAAEVESSEVVYAMDYDDDARISRLERKVDALIKYLTGNYDGK